MVLKRKSGKKNLQPFLENTYKINKYAHRSSYKLMDRLSINMVSDKNRTS